MYASPASLCCPRMLLILLPPPIKLPASWENAMREQGRCGSPSPNPSRKKTKKRSWSDIMKLGKVINEQKTPNSTLVSLHSTPRVASSATRGAGCMTRTQMLMLNERPSSTTPSLLGESIWRGWRTRLLTMMNAWPSSTYRPVCYAGSTRPDHLQLNYCDSHRECSSKDDGGR